MRRLFIEALEDRRVLVCFTGATAWTTLNTGTGVSVALTSDYDILYANAWTDPVTAIAYLGLVERTTSRRRMLEQRRAAQSAS